MGSVNYDEKIAFLRRYRDAQRTMRRCMEELAQLRAQQRRRHKRKE